MSSRWSNGCRNDGDRSREPKSRGSITAAKFTTMPWSAVGLALFMLTATIAGCSGDETDITIRSEDRTPAVPSHLQASIVSGNASAAAATPGMSWELPEGWTQEASDSPFRVAALRSPDGVVEVAVTFFAEDRASIEANLNRWRGELNLAPIAAAEAEISAPIHELNNADDRLVYRRVSLSEPETAGPRQTLVAWIQRENFGSWYFTARGNRDQLNAHADGLWAIADSFTLASDADLAAAAMDADATETGEAREAGRESSGEPEPMRPIPMDQLQLPDSSAWATFEFAVADQTASGRVPDGWTQDEEPGDRILTSLTQVDGEAKIEISRFNGDVGGMQANAIRWIRQLGHTPETASADLLLMINDDVPISMLVIAPLENESGSETFTIAAIRDAETTWFIKLSSPAADGPVTYPAFTAFVKDLKLPLVLPVPAEGWQ